MQTEETAAKLDLEYGVPQPKNMVHDVSHIDVDLDCITSGQIDWDKAVKSLQWMVDKTGEALKDHKNHAEISQYLAKTCIMHVIQCFHHCRTDKPPGFAHEGELNQTPQPSEKE